MEEKNQIIIIEYLNKTFMELKQSCSKDKGHFVNEEKYKIILDIILNSDDDINRLKELIDIEKQKLLDSYIKWEEQERELYLSRFQQTPEENAKLGITLNRQMIELLMIVNSNSVDELKKVCNELFIKFDNLNLDLNQMKEFIFDKYINDLIDRNEYYQNPDLTFIKKVSNTINNAYLTSYQMKTLRTIIKNAIELNMPPNEIFKNIVLKIPKEISDNIFVVLAESRDLSEPGINKLKIQDIKSLYNKLKEFKSITIDFEVKYQALHMANGELYFKKLERCLNFARNLHKDVRLNALIFFEDCPKHLIQLDYNEFNKKKVYNELLKYVDSTTKMIGCYNQMSLQESGYEIVKSIDVFNELITRFASDFNGCYLNREDISKNNSHESGWQKFLNIEDLCEIILIARRNLPNVEFVYNEINLEDKNKLLIFKSILDRIKTFEEKNKEKLNGKKVIDCIGTEMHLNPNVTENELIASLNTISSYEYPIKITEYDQPLSDEFIKHHSKIECEEEKQRRQTKLKSFFTSNAKKYNLKQLTIWSITDSTNFLLDIKNKSLIKNGNNPMESIYSGAFRYKNAFDYRDSGDYETLQQAKEIPKKSGKH